MKYMSMKCLWKDAVHKMEHSQATFLGAHSSTLEVLNIAGENTSKWWKIHKAGERKFQCMFCTKKVWWTSCMQASYTHVPLERLG